MTAVTIEKDGQEEAKKTSEAAGIKTLEEAISLTGFGWYHALLLVLAGFGSMGAVMEMYVVGYIIPATQCEFATTDSDKGLLGAVTFIGILLSGPIWGGVADRKGRKFAMQVTLFCDSFVGVLSALSPNYITLVVLRFFSGCLISGPATLGYTYVGEFNTQKNRNLSILLVGMFTGCVTVVLAGLAWGILPQPWQLLTPLGPLRPWRLLPIFAVLPGLICAISLFFVPETPKFLLAIGKPDEALQVLKHVYSKNTGNKPESFPVVALLGEASVYRTTGNKSFKAAVQVAWNQIAPLFKRPYLFHTILMCFIQFGNLASGCGLLLWAPELFNLQAKYSELYPDRENSFCQSAENLGKEFWNGTNIDSVRPVCDDVVKEEVFINALIIGAFALCGPLIGGSLVNVIGKKFLLIGCQIIAGIAGVALNFAPSYVSSLALSCIIIPLTGLCIAHIANVVVDLFPTHLRAMAVSLTFASGECGSTVGSFIFGFLLQSHCKVAFYFFGGVLLLNGALACLLPQKGKYAS